MELNKEVTSRKRNIYNVNLILNNDTVERITVRNEKGDQLYIGTGGSNRSKENFLVKLVEDTILNIEEKYSNYDDLKAFENWDGIIL